MKRTTLPTLLAGTTLIGAASYFFFNPIKTKVLRNLEKTKINNSITIQTSHEEAYFV